MAADLALSLAAPFIEYMITPIRREFGYILFYRSYLKDLEDGVDKLEVELEGIQHKCDAAQRNAMDIEKKVTNWIDGVNGAVKEAHTLLLGDEDQPDAIPHDIELGTRKRSFYLNPVVCYKKGRKAKKTMLVVQGLNEDKMNLGDIFFETVTSPILSANDYESFESRRDIIDNIIKALGDDKASAIGVYGMGGIGKSTLIKEVIRLAREKNLFVDVAMAVVSQNPDVKKIQEELAVWLGLKFKEDEHVSGRAARLHKRLRPIDKMKSIGESMETKKKSTAELLETKEQDAVRPEESQHGMGFQLFQWKKSTAAPRVDVEEMDEKSTKPMVEGTSNMQQNQVLIVLDDIWRGIDLEEIGIPLDGGAVKLLFTSRKQHILSSEMGCFQNVFELKVLKDEEPWRLFESIVGEKVTPDTQGKNKFISMGKEVVKKCAGLPVVLKAIATTLKNCSLPEWEDVLVQFKGSKDAYSNLEISYRHLESEELKSLFLVCALTNNASIDVQDLLYYCMGLGLLFTGTNTVRSARDNLKALLHDLQDSSLLLKEDNKDPEYVHIHDVVREVAIRIASRDEDSLLITDEFKLKKIPRKKLKTSKAISIPYVKFRKLPEGWECPELKMFLVYRRLDDPQIDTSDSYFEGMKELSVLDFSGFRRDSLPSSIQLLLNLSTLCLDGCSIEDLTLIGKLKQLQILSFIGSEIARLPNEIGELSELKVLNLKNSKLDVIEPQVLGKLTSLEELHLKGSSFIGWEDEGESQPKNAKLSELNNLSNLSIVNIHIHNPGTIPKHLEFGNLAEYIIQIGDVWDWTGDYKESRMLKIKLEYCRSSFLHEKWVQDLLKRTQNLHLDGIKGGVRSIHELCLDGFQELKHLRLQNCSLVQCVARSVSKWSPCTTFTVLESLFLEKMTGLEMIIRGPITANSFSKLKVIKVIECGKLKSLFSYSMFKCLSLLEEIEVRDCEAMQVIVTVDSVATNNEAIKLQALHRIKLHNLPNFMRFCSSHRVEVDQAEVKSQSSEIVQEDQCITTSYTMFLNDQPVSFPLLKSLILSNLPKLKHIWQYNSCPIEVANLKYLEVSSCDDLLIVIPSTLVKEVTKLETLMVRDCGMLQELFKTCDGDALNLTCDVEILSRLKTLELSNLPFLRHIWENNRQLEKVRAFQNLNLLKVVNCSSLMNLLPAALLKSLNQLMKLRIENCKEMKAVVPPENDGRSGETKNKVFESLADVWLEDLPNMVTFVCTKGGEAINFLSLKQLYVKGCPKMRSFSLLKEDENAHDELCFFDNKVRLPKLGRLDLISLRSIQKIWHEEIIEESFCSLEILVVQDCEALVEVIPSMNMTAAGIGRLQFHNLKEIIIRECSSLEGPIFKFEEVTGKGHYYCLSQLEKLWLFELPKLEHVVQPDSHVVVGFPSLVHISVSDCECIIELFPIATATTLSKLQDLKILRCSSMRRIFGKDEAEAEEDDEMLDSILFPCLHSIIIQNLDSLISLFMGISCTLGFPSLETLVVSWCSKLKTFVQSHTNDQMLEQSSPFTKQEDVHYFFDDKVELANLKEVELYELSTLQTVWKTSLPCVNICDRIGQITEINIMNCESLEEFIFVSDEKYAGGETTTTDPAIFHSLANVELNNLPNMVAFIRGRRDQTINFPFLKELYVESCPKMRAFYLPNTEESCGGGSLPLCFFDHKVLLPELLMLGFISVGSMEKIWQEETSQKSFCQIEQVLIKDCQKLVNVFPSNMIMGGFHFQNLKRICARECPSLEGSLFDFGGEEKKDSWSLPQLEILWLFDLPKLQHVVEPTSSHVYSFPNLVDVQVTDNSCVIDLFPISTAATLSKLEKLLILRCGNMRRVFGEDMVEEEKEEEMMMEDHILVFPCLRSIVVQNLDNLISFFSVTNSVLHFPSLETLQVDLCAKLKTFVQRYTIDELEESAAEGVHYLFDYKVLVPKLMQFELISVGSIEKIWHEDILEESFFHLESFIVQDCQSLVKVFPSNYVTRTQRLLLFPNLKTITITECSSLEGSLFEFVWEEGDKKLGKRVFSLPQLGKLWLFDLPKLEHVVHPTSDVVLEFQSLVDISIGDCQCLIDLFPCATATTLSKLENVKILRCSSMRYVFGKEEDAEEEEDEMLNLISFPCLRSIQVKKLNSMICFFLGTDCQLDFPSLEDLDISWCPILKTFAQRLKSEDVHYLFDDKVELANLKKVELYELSTLQTVWKTSLPCVNICDRIGQITEINIRKCEKLEEFIFVSDEKYAGGETTTTDPAIFHSLANVKLNNLPNMVAFIRGRRDQTINFPFLKELYVKSCPKMRAFYLPNTEESCGGGSLPLCFFDHKVLLPELLMLGFISVGSMEKIWQEETSQKSFCQIEQVLIKDCQKLVNVFPANMMGGFHFQNLKKISARECPLLEGPLFDIGGEKEKESKGCKKDSWSLPQLETLWLFDLPKLQHVVEPTSSLVYSFPNLVDVQIGDNPCVIDLFPISTASSLSKLEKLLILRCGNMRQVFVEDKVEEENLKEEMIMEDPILVFPCIRSIVVQNLDNLISFFSKTSSVLHFPSLETLEVDWCAKLKTFVQRYTIDELEESAAEGVHYLFDDKVDFPKLQKMKLIDLSSLQTLWKNELLPSNESCTRLKSLDVWNCDGLQHIFPPSYASGRQEIISYKERFAFAGEGSKKPLERLTAEDGELVICFRDLDHLDLSYLPNLKSFSSANCTLEFPSLEQVTVMDCPNLEVFSSSSVLAPKLRKVLMEQKETGQMRWDGDLNTTIQNLPKS